MPVLLGIGIVATLGREIVFANYLGVSRELEIFRIAFALPNMLSQSLATAYIGAMMPALILAQSAGQGVYEAFCRRLARITVAGVVALAITGALTVSIQAGVMAPGFDSASLSTLKIALLACWLFFLLAGMSFLPRLHLNRREEFWPGASASILISAVLIVAGAMVVPNSEQSGATILAYASIVAGGFILLVHTWREPHWLSTLFGRYDDPAPSSPGSDQIPAIAAPVVIVVLLHAANALPRFIDRAVGSLMDGGVVAALEYSFNIITVPGILLGSALIMVLYPEFVERIKTQRGTSLGNLPRISMGAVAVAAVGGVGIFFFADDIVRLVYARGEFDAAATAMTSTLLKWHSLGLGFMVLTMILLQACLAFSIYKILIAVALARIAAKALAVWWLVPTYGMDGLGISFIVPEALSAVLLVGVLYTLIRRGQPL
ncbi:MAG: lipid II flippase MurJ [Pseudomonadota bacterium]